MLWKVKKKKRISRGSGISEVYFSFTFSLRCFFFLRLRILYFMEFKLTCVVYFSSSPVGVFRRSSSPILSLSTTGDRAFLASSREYSLLVISVVSADIKPGSGLLQPVCSNWKITAPSQVLLESHFAPWRRDVPFRYSFGVRLHVGYQFACTSYNLTPLLPCTSLKSLVAL